jgi:hypothetical protein
MQIQFAPGGLELGQEADQVLKGSTEAIHGPSGDHIDFAPCDCSTEPVETGPGLTAFGATDAFVAVGRDHMPAMALCGFEQFSGLVGDGLFAGRDPKIQSRFWMAKTNTLSVYPPTFSWRRWFVNRQTAKC